MSDAQRVSTVARVPVEEGAEDVLATWEQRLRLVRCVEGDASEYFAVEELDEAGVIVDASRHAHEDFPVAASDYAWRALDALGFGAESALGVVTRTLEAIARSDLDALAALFHDDYLQIDHRPLGYADADKAEMLDHLAASADLASVWVTTTVHAATPAGSVGTGSYWTLNFGQWVPYEHGVHLAVVDGGQIWRAAIFPEDQVEGALALFAELTASLDSGT